MKCFASHYLLIPAVGYMKQQVVEITDEGVVRGVFPLTEEIESVEWMPGVIVLLSESQMEEIKNTGILLPCSLSTELGTDYCGSNGYIQRLGCLLACRIIGDI